MSKRFRALVIAGLLLGAGSLSIVLGHPSAHGDGAPVGAMASAFTPVVVVATPHDAEATQSEVRRLVPGAARAATDVLGVIPHIAQGVVRGDTTPDGLTAYVVADQDLSGFGAHLFRANGKVTDLGAGVLHAARPLVAENGFVYVERGKEGPQEASTFRVDRLTIDELRPLDTTPAFNTIYAASGYALHLAGEWQKRLVVYRVDEGGAAIVLVPQDRGPVKEVARIPPFARDFSLSGNRLVFSNRAPDDANEWHIVELALDSGATTVVESRRDDAAAPYALSTRTLFVGQGRTGLVELPRPGATSKTPAPDLRAPAGPGFYQVADTTPNEREWVLSFVPSSPRGALDAFDETWIVDTARNLSTRLGTEHERIEVLRIVTSPTGGVR